MPTSPRTDHWGGFPRRQDPHHSRSAAPRSTTISSVSDLEPEGRRRREIRARTDRRLHERRERLVLRDVLVGEEDVELAPLREERHREEVLLGVVALDPVRR